MATTDQQMQLKDAMARAKQIAAKLQQQQNVPIDDSRKRTLAEPCGPSFPEEQIDEPQTKRPLIGGVDHGDPKMIAQQVANSLVQRAGLGSMQVEEVKIPNKLVGLVIGRGGEMINKLQSESGAKIQVAPDPPPEMADYVQERQITITGMSDAVERAKDLIDEIKSEGKVPDRLRVILIVSEDTVVASTISRQDLMQDISSIDMRRLAGTTGPGDYSIEINIPGSKVGLIIGKGGETIKSLQERAGCKMVLFQDGEYATSTEKPLKISGEQSKVLYGQQLVQDLLTQKELEAMGQDKSQGPPGPNAQGGGYDEVQVPREAVGFVIGSKGASINMIQQQTGCRVQFKNDMDGEFKIAMLTGNPQQVAMAKAKLNEILQSHRDRRNGGEGGGGGGGNQGWGGPPGGGWNNYNNGPRHGWGGQGPRQWGPRGGNNYGNLPPGHKHMVINVPANKCGLIIGKGGETLKYIHQESKVNIEINREIPQDSPFRVFHVRGTDEQIENALRIIREKINDQTLVAKPADGTNGGGPGGQSGPGHWNGGGWGGQNQQWNPHTQQWGQGGWGPQGGQDQWGQGGWNQQQAWNQNAQWDQSQQNQWGQQYQWPAATAATAASVTAASSTTETTTNDPTQAGATQAAAGQPDYSAAWALYYQQQQQYYQQYGAQAAATTATANPTATAAVAGNQTMADYQAKLAEYYKQYGQQQPQQEQPPTQ